MAQIPQRVQTVLKQIRTLPNSARLVIGCLLVILVLSLVVVGQLTGKQSMVALPIKLDGDLRIQTVNMLKMRGIPYEERGSELLVPSEEKYTVLGELHNGKVVTADHIDFSKLIEQDTPFLSRWQNQKRWLVAKMHVIERTISQMRGIKSATVVIDEPERPGGIGVSFTPPSASVTVQTTGTALTQDQADAIAKTVARAHAGLKIEHISIVDATAGRSLRARSDDSMPSTQYLDLQLATEKLYQDKLERQLGYIGGVTVAVNVMVDSREVVRLATGYEDPKVGVTRESSRSINATNQMPTTREPGVRPNTGLDLSSGAGRSSSFLDERNDVNTIPAFGQETTRERDQKGYALQINASVGVPKSYFVGLYRDQKNDDKAQPDEATLAAFVSAETDRIVNQIRPLIDTGAMQGAMPGKIDVSMYNDSAVVMGGLIGGNGSASGGGTSGVISDGMIKYVGLGGLALVSLAMMLMMVRKAAVRDELPTPEELVGIPPALAHDNELLVGEAAEGETPLEGIEIDDAALRREEMLAQINTAARETPEELAALLRKWIRAEE